MWTIIFIITTALCAFKWLQASISAHVLAYYIKKKGYTLPSQIEIRACAREMVVIKFSRNT